MEAVWVALIVGTVSMASPLLLALLTNRQRRLEVRETYARQDAVAMQAAEAARLLVRSNEAVAKTTALTNEKLDVIHVLVNSNMTAAMQAELDATQRELAMMGEVIELKKAAGHEPSAAALAAMEATSRKIGELRASVRDRLLATQEAARDD